MKIAVFTFLSSAPWAGSEELWCAMGREALSDGHGVGVSVERWPTIPKNLSNIEKRGARLLWRSRGESVLGRSWRRLFFPAYEFFSFGPDVICINQGGTYNCGYQPRFLKALYNSGIPYVVICHVNGDAHIPSAALRDRTVEFFSRAGTVAFVAEQNRMAAERQLAMDLSDAIIIRNPVNLTDVSGVTWPAAKELQIANVARLNVAAKGQDILLETLGAPPWTERDWCLNIYGDGPDRDYLEALAHYYGISAKVHFAGHVGDVRSIWGQNHVLVLPSRFEGTPLALIEAMLCGRPVVATDVGDNAAWIDESKTGFVAGAPMTKFLNQALDRTWQARGELQDMGRLAKECVHQRIEPEPGRVLLRLLTTTAKRGIE